LNDGNAFPFTFEIEDLSGNSFIKNPNAPKEDPQLKTVLFARTTEELNKMGFYHENNTNNIKGNEDDKKEDGSSNN